MSEVEIVRTVTIHTDHKWHDLRYRDEVPADVLAAQFDWTCEDDSFGYFRYKGYWYHIEDFMAVDTKHFPKWRGYLSDSFFSGILIEISPDGEQYMVGRYYS